MNETNMRHEWLYGDPPGFEFEENTKLGQWLVVSCVVLFVAVVALLKSNLHAPIWSWFIVLGVNLMASRWLNQAKPTSWRWMGLALAVGPLTMIGYSTWMGALMIQVEAWGVGAAYAVIGMALAWIYGLMIRSHWPMIEFGIATGLGLSVPLLITGMHRIDPLLCLLYVAMGVIVHYLLGAWRWRTWRKEVEIRRINKAMAPLEGGIAGHHAVRTGVVRDLQVKLLSTIDETKIGLRILDKSLTDDRRYDVGHLKNCVATAMSPVSEVDAHGPEYWTTVDRVNLPDAARVAATAARQACPSANIQIFTHGYEVLQVPWRCGADALAWCLARLITHFVKVGASRVTLDIDVDDETGDSYVNLQADAPLEPEHRRGLHDFYRSPEHIAVLPDYLQRITHYISASGGLMMQEITDRGKGHLIGITFVGDFPERDEQMQRGTFLFGEQTRGTIN